MATRIKRINKIVSQDKRVLWIGLPYWHVMGKQGVTAEEMLGCEILIPERGETSRLEAYCASL
ncbi:hypothetical protein J7L00_07460 [Candidatus Bathyarchaeota archaeon]|nr:hypothetical protein [Candidatus Bathyarchaeota archaeon]